MTIQIRQAGTADAGAIACIKRVAFDDDTADETLIATALSQTNRVTHVALIDNTIVGYVDGFTTQASSGAVRWEVDTLAVAPDYWGRGIGSRLVARSTSAAEQHRAVLARGLVCIGNIASERAFAASGYEPSCPQTLYIYDGAPQLESSESAGLHLIPVTTFTYIGGWIEGDITCETLSSAAAQRTANDWHLLGTIIADTDEAALQAVQQAGYNRVDTYRWWQRALTSGAGQARRSGHRFCES